MWYKGLGVMEAMMDDNTKLPVFPIVGVGLRGYWARRDICPECGSDLDTGWECNTCGYDATSDARP